MSDPGRQRASAYRARLNNRRYAREEAAAQKPKVEIVTNDGGTVVARIRSDSDPNLTYTLHGSQNGKYVTCSCRGYNSHGHCKHQAALAATMQEGAFLP